MSNQRIKDYVEEIFRGVAPGVKVTEQKEELVVNITERVQDYMGGGMSFDAAFETAKETLGDVRELTAPFEGSGSSYGYGSQTPPRPSYGAPVHEESKPRYKISFSNFGLVPLSVFAYVLIGILWNSIGHMPPMAFIDINWWAWGWIMIPGSAILCTPMRWTTKLVSLSPFIYLLLGFWFGLWAFGWVIIPIAGLLEAGLIKVVRE